MSDETSKTSKVDLTVKLDENHIPLEIDWYTSDGEQSGKCEAAFLALWDKDQKNTMRLDLWTKEFPLDEMKQFFYQNLLTLADTFERASGEEAIVEDLRDYCAHFAEKMGLEEGNGDEGNSNGAGQG